MGFAKSWVCRRTLTVSKGCPTSVTAIPPAGNVSHMCVCCSRHVPCVDLRSCLTACSGKNVFGSLQNWTLGLYGPLWHVGGQLQQGDALQFPPGRFHLSNSAARAVPPASMLASEANLIYARRLVASNLVLLAMTRGSCDLLHPGHVVDSKLIE